MTDARWRMGLEPSLTTNDVIMTSPLLLKLIDVFANFLIHSLSIFRLKGKIDGIWILPILQRDDIIMTSKYIIVSILVTVS